MKKNYLYEIVENEFHGGGHLAYATTLENAARAANRLDRCSVVDKGQSQPRCCCGGPAIRFADGRKLDEKTRDELEEICYKMQSGTIRSR